MIRSKLFIAVLVSTVAAGCCEHKCCLNKDGCRPKPYLPPPPTGPVNLPPGGVPTTPLPSPPGTIPPAGVVVPGVGPTGQQNYYPPPVAPSVPNSPSYKPAPEVLFPDPLPGTSRSSTSGVPTPSAGTPSAALPQRPAKSQTAEPPMAAVSAAPTGLPDFTKVKDGLASGRKPDLDGFTSLKQMGYRTVIYLHAPGADLSAVRDLASGRGLAFISIETTPEKLPAALDAFTAAVRDKSVRPAYVFDEDGVRAGAVWYLFFKSAGAMNDDVARVLAKPLGLTDRGEEAQAFSLAIQRYLELR